MNKSIKKLSYILTLFLTIFALSTGVFAAAVPLPEGGGSSNENVDITADSDLTCNYGKGSEVQVKVFLYRPVSSVTPKLYKVVKNDNLYIRFYGDVSSLNDGTGKFGCPKEIYYTSSKNGDRESWYVTLSKQSGNSGDKQESLKLISGSIYEVSESDLKNYINKKVDNTSNSNIIPCTGDGTSLLGNPKDKQAPAYWLQWILNVMKYVGIVALFVLILIDFMQALVKNDKDALKKAATKSLKRFVFCVLLFFLPNIIEFIMEAFGAYGTCDIR